MSLRPGGRLGPFEIVAPLGAGGMGEVYEARDTRLGRTVAIKILPAGLAENAERLARFQREARAVSQLSHPNVCTLHDVGEEEGVHFLVMEHCEGETLADRLRRGAMDLPQVLRDGAEIAEALHAAHRRAIVHRDLKPGNIMLTPGGVKLLDFGLARVAESSEGESGVGELPTVARSEQPLTADGVVLGTYPYMAPEQVEGAETDARSDVFALGAVLYEMVTGRRAFAGKSAASVMAAVLKEDPAPITSVQPVSPPALEHVVSRCLAKDPEDRWQSARDVAVELRWIEEAGSAAGVAAPVMRRRKSRERLAWLTAAALGLLLAILAAIWAWTPEPPEPPVVKLAIDIPTGSSVAGPSVSPDGRTIAYSLWKEGKGQLYLHPLDALEPTPVLGATNATYPFFSPDGGWIGYFADGALRKIPVSGGSPVTIAAVDRHRGATWREDGTIIFSKGPPTGLWEVPDSGATAATELTQVNVGARENRVDAHFQPDLLPGTRGVVFTAWSPGEPIEFTTMALDFESGEMRRIVEGSAPILDESGRLLYIDSANHVLNAVSIDLETLDATGQPTVISRDVGSRVASRGGTLAFETLRQAPQRLVRVDAAGAREILPMENRQYERIVISPDGTRAAIVIDEGDEEIWIVDLERGTSSRLTTYRGFDSFPIWTPDGDWIVFASDRAGPPNLYRVRARGGNVERLSTAMAVQAPAEFVAGGKVLMSFRDLADPGTDDIDIGTFDPATGEVEPLIAGDSEEAFPRLSPDGRWMLYRSNETGQGEIYLSSYPDLREKLKVTLNGSDSHAEWAPDGRSIYYVSEDVMMAVPFSTDPGPRLGEPVAMFDAPQLVDFDIGPDGDFLLAERTGPHEREIVVVVNWTRELDAN